MAPDEYRPGKSARIQLLGAGGRCSNVVSVVSAKAGDVYVTPRIVGDAIKVSLHRTGWRNVGFKSDYRGRFMPPAKHRHWDSWKGDREIAPGVRLAWYLLVPDEGLNDGHRDDRAHKLPPVGEGYALSLNFYMVADAQPIALEDSQTTGTDYLHVVGRWPLGPLKETCLVVARRIPWTVERRAHADQARISASADLIAAGIRRTRQHWFYLHGRDDEGVGYGLEVPALGSTPPDGD